MPARLPNSAPCIPTYMAERLGPSRDPAAPVEKVHRDGAASLQARLEEVLFEMLRALHARTRQKAVCLAGGVAFNCVANGKIFDETPFEQIFVQPAAGDAGLAVGAAYFVHHQVLGQPRSFVMENAYWGPGYTPEQVRAAVAASRLRGEGMEISELPEEVIAKEAAKEIAAGKILGWFQGRAEWGPRALGNRSIVADPRRADMKDILNARIKHREMFRPFAPSVLAEATGEYFEKSYPSPFMTQAYSVRPEKRAVIPAPTHVDGTGRLQTVTQEANPRYWRLIREFGNLTGVPVVLNTSFNDNEPIVCRPEEAIECFLRTKMDVLVLGDILVRKPATSASLPRLPLAALRCRADPAHRFPVFRRFSSCFLFLSGRACAHSSPERIFPAGHQRHGQMRRAGGRGSYGKTSRHGSRGPPELRSDRIPPAISAAARSPRQPCRRARRFHGVSAIPDAPPRLELSDLSFARGSAGAHDSLGRGPGHDRPAHRRHCRSPGRPPIGPALRVQHPGHVSGHGRRRFDCSSGKFHGALGSDASLGAAAALHASSCSVRTCATASSPKESIRAAS